MPLELVWVNPDMAFAKSELPLRWDELTDPTEFEMSVEQDFENAADISAHRFLIEILLAELLHRVRISNGDPEGFVMNLLRVSQQTDQLPQGDSENAKMAAAIAIRMQEKIEDIVSGAAARNVGR